MTSLYLYIFWVILVSSVVLLINYRKRKLERSMKRWITTFPAEKKKNVFSNFSVEGFLTNKSRTLLLSIPIAIIAGFFTHYFLDIAWMIGSLVGLLLPWTILVQLQRNYEVKYRLDGKKAIEFLGAILEAGGTLEDWMREVIPRLEGPLVPIFQRGVINYGPSFTVENFLEKLIKSCPDSYLQLFFSGLLHEQRNSGDMKKYTDEALNDMVNQERFIRIMRMQRIAGQRMLIYIAVFPMFLYVLFKDAIHRTMYLHPSMSIIFIIGMSGYVFFIWYGLRITKDRMI